MVIKELQIIKLSILSEKLKSQILFIARSVTKVSQRATEKSLRGTVYSLCKFFKSIAEIQR
jgi:hypothetical protein